MKLSRQKRQIKCSRSFDEWYDSLPSRKQAEVDDLADDLGLPLYDDCSEAELASLHDCFVSRPKKSAPIPPGLPPVRASYDPSEPDTYVVKIWYEVEPDYDTTVGPVAAEEVFFEVATSPQEAIEYAKRQWDGPIDRIEIVDVNPEPGDYEIPFEASCDVTASTSMDVMREELLRNSGTLLDEDIDKILAINWTDVVPEDTEFLAENDALEDIDNIESIRYADELVDRDEFEGGYEITYKDGSKRVFGFYAGEPELHEVDANTCVSASEDFLTEEQKEILRNADTSDWAEMQNERTQDQINRAGGYANWIRQARDRERKNCVNCAEDVEGRKMSQASFDFVHDGYYAEVDIDNVIELAFSDAGVAVEGTYYHEVDYSDYPEYADDHVTQVDVDFSWIDDYNSDLIEYNLENELESIGYALIGIDFRSLQ